jgi:hypothetical protein
MAEQKILDRLQKLLRLAADNPDSPESQLAGERAAELMAKYNVGLEDVKEDGTIDSSNILESDVVCTVKHHQAWETDLASALCEAFDCQRILTNADNGAKVRRFIGTKSDVAVLVNFYKYLRLRIAKEAEHKYRLQRDQKMFGIGVARELRPRLVEMYKRKQEVSSEATNALVVCKKDAVANFLSSQYPSMKMKSYSMGSGSMAAYRDGLVVGKSMSINQQVGG